jgi:anhydro-N-acetylmuramic acid kinase
MSDVFLGLMSGTSCDAIDAALVRIEGSETTLIATHEHPIPSAVRDQVRALSHPGDNEIECLGCLDQTLAELFADASLQLLSAAGCHPGEVAAIGSHGQTVRHRPPSAPAASGIAFTLQIGDPNTIAERTGITTVADFRRRDIACGGEGAPLAPAFHGTAFGAPGVNRAIVNIGGIANVSILQGRQTVAGFDTGPGNTLLDAWIHRHRDEPCDHGGRWAATGEVHGPLLDEFLAHPYLQLRGPRSTGKEAFNLAWLDGVLKAHGEVPAADVQATLVAFTARSITAAISATEPAIEEVFVCGGGSHNHTLMEALRQQLAALPVHTTAALGVDPDWVEAAAFAWLASRTLAGEPGNVPAVTGASRECVLGAIFPAPGNRGQKAR